MSKIKIKSAPGLVPAGNTEGTDELVNRGVYFEETSTAGQFFLYAPSATTPPGPATQIPTTPSPVTTNTNFTFSWGGAFWSITNFQISQTPPPHPVGSASGSWSSTTLDSSSDAVPSGGAGDVESGTFQANDTVDVEGEASASAYA